jgi:ribosomal protein S18 acetylase RimI-like enzyme
MIRPEFSCQLNGTLYRILATIDGQTVGEMTWTDRKLSASKPRGEVLYIWTHPGFRRRGIATAMWQHAQQVGEVKPRHSRNRSSEGRAWITSLV